MADPEDRREGTGLAPAPSQATQQVTNLEASVVVRKFHLRARGADGAAEERFTASRPRTVIGTHASSDIVLPDKTMSRFHAEILVDEGRARIRDLGSLNGTWVNGIRVLEAFLQDG